MDSARSERPKVPPNYVVQWSRIRSPLASTVTREWFDAPALSNLISESRQQFPGALVPLLGDDLGHELVFAPDEDAGLGRY